MRNLTGRSQAAPEQQHTQYEPGTALSKDTDSDVIADIIAQLVDEEHRLSRPPSYNPSFSWDPLQPADIERVSLDSRTGIPSARDSLDFSDRADTRPISTVPISTIHQRSQSHNFVSDVVVASALQAKHASSPPALQAKHSSYAPALPAKQSSNAPALPAKDYYHGLPDPDSRSRHVDSAISLQPWKHKSGLSIPNAARMSAMHQPESSVVSPIERPWEHQPWEDEQDEPAPDSAQPPTPQYPSRAKTIVIMLSLYISIFLVALDRTIMGPAIPEITNKFHSTDDIGWYGSAYMLTSCGFILTYGRIYTFFTTKYIYLSAIVLFEVGSAVCGAATSSLMLIIGRAIAGLGSSGIFTGAILIMLNTVPLHRRPMLQGLFGACFGVASVTGPLLGGAFTGSSLTWRWCFYINLPLGGFTLLVVMFFLHLDENKPKLANWKETAKHLDPVGTALFLPSITCLLLALEWGAAEYSWSAPLIIGLLTAFAALFVAFIGWQYYTRHTTATVPGRIFFQRSVAFGGLSQFFVGATMLTVSIYIPLWFQAIKGASAIQSGINTIPLVLAVVVGSISSGGLVQKIGYYTPFMILGACLMAIGSGLLTTWNVNTPSSHWIPFQIILGLGVGYNMQHPNLAVQVVLSKQDVATGTALLSLCQTLGGAVFTAVGQNLFIDKFTMGLEHIGGLHPKSVINAGATSLKTAVPVFLQARVLSAYNTSLTQGPFLAAVFVACLAVPAALGMEWRSVKQVVPPGDPREQEPPQDLEKLDPNCSLRRQDSVRSLRSKQSMRSLRHQRVSREAPRIELPDLPDPIFRWQSLRRPNELGRWLSVKVNPDLKQELLTREMLYLSMG